MREKLEHVVVKPPLTARREGLSRMLARKAPIW